MKMLQKIAGMVSAIALAASLFLSAAPVSVSAANGTTTVTSALIQGANVVVAANGYVATDDGLYHLYAQDTYMSGTQGVEVAQAAAGSNAAFAFALGKNTAASNLFKKFTVVGKVGGVQKAISNAMYITNPEAVATHTAARHDGGKKGILPAAQMITNTAALKNMGVKQVTYNLPVGDLISGKGVPFTYNGKSYNFSQATVGQYDLIVPQLNAAGIQVNLILLCGANSGYLIHPQSRGVGANYYMFNTADAQGLETLEAVAAFLGQRYSNNGHGTVDNWTVGNEVNARQEWNYMNAAVGLPYYAKAYADELRVVYNGIKSENANARIYAATDQEWVSDNPRLHYGNMEFLTQLNAQVTSEGNFDYGLANHPYNFPLYEPNVLLAKPQVTHNIATNRYLTMANIDVLTDFLSQPGFRSPNGQVRSVLLSEVGYTSSPAMASNEALQAASIVFAINQAEANQHIDGIVINRQLSDISEIAQGLDYGLLNVNGTPKQAYSWFTTATNANTIAAAGAVLGMNIPASIVRR